MSDSDTPPALHDDPPERLRAEAHAFYRIFRFHGQNNHIRKAVTLMVVAVWAILEVVNAAPGLVPGEVMLPEQFYLLRVVVGVIIGRMWDIELDNLGGFGGNDGHR